MGPPRGGTLGGLGVSGPCGELCPPCWQLILYPPWAPLRLHPTVGCLGDAPTPAPLFQVPPPLSLAPWPLPVLLWGLAWGHPLEPRILQQKQSHQQGAPSRSRSPGTPPGTKRGTPWGRAPCQAGTGPAPVHPRALCPPTLPRPFGHNEAFIRAQSRPHICSALAPRFDVGCAEPQVTLGAGAGGHRGALLGSRRRAFHAEPPPGPDNRPFVEGTEAWAGSGTSGTLATG